MNDIINLYKSKFKFISFYDLVSYKILNNSLISDNYHFTSKTSLLDPITYKAKLSDIRVDLPIWFGDQEKIKLKVMILGREPRDSHDKYNIEVNDDNGYVFGSPFGIEYWSEKNKYFRSFKTLIRNKEILSYFTDVVKTYEVKDSKSESDFSAKVNFWSHAESDINNLEFLKQEVDLLGPDLIIGLGNDSFNFLNKHFAQKYSVKKVIHPNARQDKQSGKNAWEIAEIQINDIIKTYY
jgi:hypothetical protein